MGQIEQAVVEPAVPERAENPASAYMRELAAGSEMDKAQEREHANALVEAREAFARGVLELEATCRETVLADDSEGPEQGRRWSLEKIEVCWERIKEHARGCEDEELSRRLHRLAGSKRAMDAARDGLILGTLRFVPHLVRQMGHKHRVPFMDLVQEGNLGLMRAVDRFDPELGHRFSTYAFWWIRQAVYKALEQKSRMIRLPGHVLNNRREMRRVRGELLRSLGREPSVSEIAQQMDLPLGRVRDLLNLVAEPRPLEAFESDADGVDLHERIADTAMPTPLDTALDHEVRERLAAALNLLTPREEEIVRLRFGIDRPGGHTLKDIGERFKLTRERIRQIERSALAKIQAADSEVFGSPRAEAVGA